MSVRYKHSVRLYVPVFQVENTFEYSLTFASTDEQMVASMSPDYILELNGEFDATTKELDEDSKSTAE